MKQHVSTRELAAFSSHRQYPQRRSTEQSEARDALQESDIVFDAHDWPSPA
jgi:hypothetical protein